MSYRVLVLLLLTTIPPIAQSAPKVQATGSVNAVKTMVNALYHSVVIHHPYSLLDGPDAKMFSPYLSESLSQKLQSARDCSRDWFRQNQGKAVKAPFAWSAFGIFSGYNERDSPGSFKIESIQAEPDGSFRADVVLTYKPADGPGSWRVSVRIVQQHNRPVVEDVTYLRDQPGDSEKRLSEILSDGCDGSRWVGQTDR
jgi:hypothetical protein